MRDSSRTILLLTLAHFSHHVLTALLTPLLPFIRDDLGLNYAQAGLVMAAFSLSYGFGQIPAGRLADRIGPRIVLTAGIAGVGAAGLLLGLSSGYAFLIGSLVLMGILGGGYHPAAAPLISAAAEPGKQAHALGLHVIGGSVSYFAAPLLGVALAAALGWRGAFLALSIPVILLGAIVYRACLHRSLGGPATTPTAEGEARNKLSAAVVVELSTFIIMVTAMGAALASASSFLTLYIVDALGASEQSAAALLALYFSAGIWAAPLGGRLADRFGRKRVAAIASFAAVAGLLALPRIPYGFGFVALLAALGAVPYVRMPAAEAYLTGRVPASIRSTVLGIYFFAGMEGSGVLTPLLGAWIDSQGFQTGFTILGLGLGAVVALCAAVLAGMERRGMAKAA
jgi:MFS family permease